MCLPVYRYPLEKKAEKEPQMKNIGLTNNVAFL